MKWSKINDKLELKLTFNSQTELATFLLEVAQLADNANHHPDIEVKKAFELTLKLFTHDEGKITSKDIALSDQILTILKCSYDN